ncbi:MAG: carbon-nitrogen hydrolase family protein [Alphaproteobacteria bacterium]|nr:carbon-nitrogen hydrolase family protein [Alphaproteobacteria bacterium]
MKNTVRVAAVQMGAGVDVAENLATCLRMIDQAATHAPDLMVLPEFVNHCSWYDDNEHCYAVAVPLDGPFTAAIAGKAREHNCHIVINCTVRRRNNGVTSTNILFGPDGTQLANSDKQVLMGGENNWLERASELGPITDTAIGKLGMFSCMDGVMNETPRCVALRGAQIMCNTLNSFANDEATLHIPVRAAENRTFVVAANKIGPLVPPGMAETVAAKLKIAPERLNGAGESQIVAPDGTVLARAPESGEAVVVADIEIADSDVKRRPDGTHVFRSRRPDLYGPIAEAPRERVYRAKSDALTVGVFQPAADGPDALAEVVAAIAAMDATVGLVVLPELFDVPGGQVVDAPAAARQGTATVEALRAALVGRQTVVVTSIVEAHDADFRHTGLAVGADGVLLRQPQLHACGRHPWVSALGNGIATLDLAWGRLALITGGDSIFPEAFRLAALQDVEVVAVPTAVIERWENDFGLAERAAENRMTIVAGSRASANGVGMVAAPDKDFTLWTQWSRPFNGDINYPNVTLASGDAGLTVATVDPSTAGNRTVTLMTDVVSSRPWKLLGPLVAPVGNI